MDDKDNEDPQQQQDEDDAKVDQGVPPSELMDDILKRGEKVILEWHDQILKYPPKIDAFLDGANVSKNRFPNVLLYDKTRIKIEDDKLGGDYYHSSYVDSYEKPDGYALAQAPFDEITEIDFWRLSYQIKPALIVLLTALKSNDGKRMCSSFWPEAKEEKTFAQGAIKVRCSSMDNDRDFDSFDLSIGKEKKFIKTQLMHFRKWVEDREIPDNLLEFRAMVKIAIARAEKEGRGDGPLLLVCPSGVTRCGTLAALDIVIDRMTNERKVGLLETIAVIKRQRYGCFTHFDHFSHVADLIVRHAVSSGIVDPGAIGVRRKN